MTPGDGRCAQGGFAFLWTLMLVALMGLGLTAAVQFESSLTQRQKEKELLSIGRQFRDAIGRYYELQLPGRSHEYPRSLDDLLRDERLPVVTRHLRKVFTDPMTGKAEWGFLLVGGRIAGIHSLSDAAPIKQAGFEAEDMTLADKKSFRQWIFAYPADLTLRPTLAAPSSAASTPQPLPVASLPGFGASAPPPMSVR